MTCFTRQQQNARREWDIEIRSVQVHDEAVGKRSLWRDRWARVGVVGIVLSCLACTSVSAVILGALGVGLWVARVEAAAVVVFAASVIVLGWRYARRGRRR